MRDSSRTGRLKSPNDNERENSLAAVENPAISVRRIARIQEINKTSLHEVLIEQRHP